MTTRTAKLRSFGDDGPVTKSYRRYLARASITMFALILVSAYLLPLLYMLTTALQQPTQRSTPGAPIYPAVPLTATYQGAEYPIFEVTISGAIRNLMLVEKGRDIGGRGLRAIRNHGLRAHVGPP